MATATTNTAPAIAPDEPKLTGESVVALISPTLDRFVEAAEPACRKASEGIYELLLDTVQDYLRSNAEWNIGGDIARCRTIEADNRDLREINREMLAALEGLQGILATAESNASGNPEWNAVHFRVVSARVAIARAKGESA